MSLCRKHVYTGNICNIHYKMQQLQKRQYLPFIWRVCFRQAFKPIMMLYTNASIDKRGQMFEIYSLDVMLLICRGVIQLLGLNPVQKRARLHMWVHVDP